MSFLKKLFGGGKSEGGSGASASWDAPTAEVEHEGYAIATTPMKEGGQFRLAGTISKEIDGEMKSHQLIRADVFPSADECSDACIRKAKQVISEQGDGMFS